MGHNNFVYASVLHLAASSHPFARTHHLVHQQELLGEGWGDVEPLLLGAVVVEDLLLYWGNVAHGLHVESDCDSVLVVLIA